MYQMSSRSSNTIPFHLITILFIIITFSGRLTSPLLLLLSSPFLPPSLPLFLPSFLPSKDASIQCNARSGKGTEGRDAIDSCGFSNAAKDQQRVRNDEIETTAVSEEETIGSSRRLRKGKDIERGEKKSDNNDKKKKKGKKKKGKWAPEGEQWTFEN